MRKLLLVVAMVIVSTTILNAAPLLVEAYREGSITIPEDETDTLDIAQVAFSVDSTCYVLFATGGVGNQVEVWLDLDGERLPPVIRINNDGRNEPIGITYSYLVNPGEHSVSFKFANHLNIFDPSTCQDSYLQALIFLPDETGAIAERPDGDVDADATGAMTSVISRGPYVTVTGATELVDASGRVIENAIEEDRVSINNLSQGTYFARKEGKTLVKIVKVQ